MHPLTINIITAIAIFMFVNGNTNSKLIMCQTNYLNTYLKILKVRISLYKEQMLLLNGVCLRGVPSSIVRIFK